MEAITTMLGAKLEKLLKENERLQRQVIELQKRNEDLKIMVEEILCSPGSNDYHAGRPHPMTDESS